MKLLHEDDDKKVELNNAGEVRVTNKHTGLSSTIMVDDQSNYLISTEADMISTIIQGNPVIECRPKCD